MDPNSQPANTEPAPLAAWKKLAIWAAFLALLYLARDFFFVAFVTFLLCYLTLSVVGWQMRLLSPGRERPWLRRLLVLALFVVTPLALFGAGVVVAPRVIEQGQRLAGWMSQVTPETEVTRLLEGFVGPYLFEQKFGGPKDEEYQEGLKEFRAHGAQHVKAYQEFPNLEAWVEGGFRRQFDEAERARVRARLLREGTSSKEFAAWFVKDKVPELQEQARELVPKKGRPSATVEPLVRAAATASPEQLLQQARHDRAALATLRAEWMDDTVDRELAAAHGSSAYHEQLRDYYEKQRARSPATIPYTFEQYAELQKVRPQGPQAFGKA